MFSKLRRLCTANYAAMARLLWIVRSADTVHSPRMTEIFLHHCPLDRTFMRFAWISILPLCVCMKRRILQNIQAYGV